MAYQNETAIRYESSRLQDYRADGTIDRGRADLSLIMMTLLLLTVGVIMVLSASYANAYYTRSSASYYFVHQLLYAITGIAIMFVASRFPMSMYRRFAGPVLLAAFVLLVIVLVRGRLTNGATRWINLGFTTIQPSEVAKLGLVLYYAAMINRNRDKMRTFRYGILPFISVLAIIIVLLAMEPHVSAILIIAAIAMVMLFVGGVRLYWFIGGGVALSALLLIAYGMFDYVKKRITAWQNPFLDPSDTGYQVVQSLYAIGSGGLRGLGLGNSRQKFLYLPEEHNDYIFSVVCEELGYIGAVLILALFAVLILRCYYVSMHARDRFSMLVGVGVTTQLALQVIMNVAVCTNSIPCTGVSLPFFSYGGTAMWLHLGEIGILLSISRDIPERSRQAP